jgi:tight adherence protein B
LKRLTLIAAFALASALLSGSAAAAPSGGLSVEKAQGPPFPVRRFVLTLPTNQKLTIHDVHVRENGRSVLDPTLVPASKASAKSFGVVLLLDTSYSMNGAPVTAAIRAAQAFALQRNPNEGLGVIEFNKQATVAQLLTTSKTKINEALAQPPKINTGTHIYDAVAEAEAMLKSAGVNSGSIVVLSDGADTGSTKTVNEVASAALKSHTKIYTVGLQDASYDPRTLRALARKGHGEYARANTGALPNLFDQLSQELSNQYILQYKSLAGPNVPIRVRVSVNGVGTDVVPYRTPRLAGTSTTATSSSASDGGIWGPATMVVLALLAAAALAVVIIALFRPTRTGLPARMAEFVSIRELQRNKGQTGTGTDDDTDASEELGFWARFQETLEIAEIKVPAEAIVAGTVVVTILVFIFIYAVTSSWWWSLLALVIPYLSREWVLRTLAKKRNRFAEQLPDALQVVASALRSGHSFAGALAVVVESASEPMKTEMQRVVADEQLGVPIQDSLGVVAHRMASRDIEQLALVAQLQREAGGDAAEVVDRVAETVRERFDLKRLIQTLTMQGRMSRWIVSGLPIFIVLVVTLENPHYFHPLTSTLGGRILLIFAAAWAVAGSLVIKRIVEIEV